MLAPPMVGDRHYRVARKVRETLPGYDELKDVIAHAGLEELSRAKTSGPFTEPGVWSVSSPSRFSPPEQFTGREGKMVELGRDARRLRTHPER